MDGRIDKNELTKRVALRLEQDTEQTEVLVDAVLEEIYEALKNGESVTIRNFGDILPTNKLGGFCRQR